MTQDGNLPRGQVVGVLKAIGDDLGLVVVGGQAIGLWAEQYADEAPELAVFAPFRQSEAHSTGVTALRAVRRLVELHCVLAQERDEAIVTGGRRSRSSCSSRRRRR